MKIHKLSERGVTHQLMIIGIVTVAVVGGVFGAVLKAHHTANSQSDVSASSADKKKLASKQASKTNLATEQTSSPQHPATDAAKPSTGSTASAPKATAPSAKKNTAETPAPVQSPAPIPAPTPAHTETQSPLSVLTALITNLDNGAQVNVAASAVTVPGPISNAQARPIIFVANGQKYFAYTQGHAPNFTTSPSQTAASMAIVATSGDKTTVQAHLDQAANLVDPDISGNLVGYSQGGN